MGNPVLVDPETVRTTAAEAWIWGFALLENYRAMYPQAIDDADPRHVGGFGVFRHHPQPFTPANTDVVTPNNDTPYSWAWLDLRAEPWVIEVPATDRYYVLPVHDLDTSYVGFIGARTTGPQAGRYLITGPGHPDPGRAGQAHADPAHAVAAAAEDRASTGTAGQGFDGVLRADTNLVGILGRTYLAGPADVPALRAVQAHYALKPLSAHLGTAPPPAAPDPVWPVWREEVLDTLEFFVFLDFLLGFFPVLPTEAALRSRLAELGVGTGDFEPAALPLDIREAILQGIEDGRARLAEAAAEGDDSIVPQPSAGGAPMFGTRAQHGSDYLTRAVGVRKGLYGLPAEETWCAGWPADDQGNRPPDASKHDYTLHFPAGKLPPARYFWSATVYRLPERLLVGNPIDRYSIGDRTPGLVYGEDGSLTLHIQHDRPAEPGRAANWLPAPDGPFGIVIRVYGPDQAVLDGRWPRPQLTVHG